MKILEGSVFYFFLIILIRPELKKIKKNKKMKKMKKIKIKSKVCNCLQFMVSYITKCVTVVNLWCLKLQSVYLSSIYGAWRYNLCNCCQLTFQSVWMSSIYVVLKYKVCNCRQFMLSQSTKCVTVVNLWCLMSESV